MNGFWIGAAFLIGLGLVAAGWWGLLRLSFLMEKQRFGWNDEEALTRFLSMRRSPDKRGDKHMRAYIRGELHSFAEGIGAGLRYRLSRLMVRVGYGLLIVATGLWFAGTVTALW
ncbi:hypothetical protein ACFPOD_04155 [Nitratireductor kimnyeongensis]|uniref:Uncharacterized protein n=1 Tax=Nitratireductor kimnyeongensis TaxID=430679 RepID=A0ABW0T661_9HYPH|nr:hypothetical protein [Nitratireductor kimnyeongensis]QZZ34712.1 hypothetical protein KW403_13040 [Nitratireductor kimnyeongensis]